MPSKGTTRRSIRLEDDLWAAAITKAAAEGTDVSAVVRSALADYVAAKPIRKRKVVTVSSRKAGA